MGIMSPIAKIIGGGVVGASAVGAYNYFEGRRGGAGEGFKMGAIAAAGLLLSRKGNFKATSNFAKGLAGKIPKGVTNTIGGWGNSAFDWALRKANASGTSWIGDNARALAYGAKRAVPGAIYGAAGGAVYGAFSDRESMMSGAFKGALLGAAGNNLMKLNRGKNLMKVMSAKGAVSNPASKAAAGATAASTASARTVHPAGTWGLHSFVPPATKPVIWGAEAASLNPANIARGKQRVSNPYSSKDYKSAMNKL